MPSIKLRFNTEHADSEFRWRVLIDGVEHLAKEVKIQIPTYTSEDVLPDGRIKYHISADAQNLTWNDGTLTIE